MITYALIALAAAGALLVCLAWRWRVLVPEDHVGIVHRRVGHVDPEFPGISVGTANRIRGLQARTLAPGRVHWVLPFLQQVELAPCVRIPAGQIGLVTARAGRKRPPGRPLGRSVDCDDFQDGQAFLARGGEQGPQVAVLPDDMTYFINTRLFDVVTVPRTHVPLGTVGLVTAVAGRVRPTDRPFARHVQCDDFQDGDAFLVNGGEQGRQLSVVLAGGTSYAINPLLFKVTTVNNLEDSGDGLTSDDLREVAVPIGYAGVVVTLDGDIPNRSDGDMIGPIIPGHRSFQLPWVFLEQGGVRGVQEEVLSEGETYALNPWFVRVVLVPTRYLILEWRTSENWESLNHDAHLDEITFSVQGHRLRLPLTQTLRIPASAAPRLVSAFGSPSGLGGVISYRVTMQRFADRVLGTTVANFLHGLAATSTVDDLIGRYHQIKVELSDQIRASLDEWGVVALETVMGPFEVEDPRLNETLRRIVETRTTETTKSQLLMHENQIDEMRVRAERRRAALELEREVELLGYDNVEMRRIIGKISKMQVPMAVSADISGLLDYLPMTIASSLLRQLRELRTAQGKKTEGSPENPSQL